MKAPQITARVGTECHHSEEMATDKNALTKTNAVVIE